MTAIQTRTQQFRQLALASPLGDDVLLLKGFSGTERLAEPFEYSLDLLSEDPFIRFEDIVARNVSVRVQKSVGEEPRCFNGFVSSFAMVRPVGGMTEYRATIVPWLWFLTRTSDCRIFQAKSVPEIVQQVFRDHGFTDFEDRLTADYRTWDYCVQYRETDFNFISRLLEQEGIYYYFRHENGLHTLILADDPAAHDAVPDYEEIPYRPPTQSMRRREHISHWSVVQRVQPAVFSHNDFDFEIPAKSLLTSSKISHPDAAPDFEIYDYPGEYVEHADGEAYARRRIEEYQARYEAAEGRGDARGIATGCKFRLADHPRQEQLRQYLVTSTRIEASSDLFGSGASAGAGGEGEANYTVAFTAMDADRPFRPARAAAKPEIRGPQTAMVVGPAGQEIHTDKYGRVKVQFHWDRYGKADENSSCWVRVAQVWAGKKWGAMFIPRIGQEVIVEFLEADPDRPIVTGRVYNGGAMPPYDLPGNMTMSTLKTLSSKGGEGFNEVRFEDKKGAEQIFIHAERNQDVRIKNDRFEWVGNDRHVIVKKDRFDHVENSRHEKVDMDHMEEIGRDRHLKVKGKEARQVDGSRSLTVAGDVIEVFKANHAEQVTGELYVKAKGMVFEATSGITLKVGGSNVVIDSSGVTVKGGTVTLDGGTTNINCGPGSPAASGTPGSAVAPAAPTEALEADLADPGKMTEVKAEQAAKKAGKYGSAPVKPYKPDERKTSWIEIELVDEEDNPVAGERYRVTLPDGETVAEGSLDNNGLARIDGIDPGNCRITFPELDEEAWEKA
jgi:type VI secretion system secreted protein VgrG